MWNRTAKSSFGRHIDITGQFFSLNGIMRMRQRYVSQVTDKTLMGLDGFHFFTSKVNPRRPPVPWFKCYRLSSVSQVLNDIPFLQNSFTKLFCVYIPGIIKTFFYLQDISSHLSSRGARWWWGIIWVAWYRYWTLLPCKYAVTVWLNSLHISKWWCILPKPLHSSGPWVNVARLNISWPSIGVYWNSEL